MASQMTRNRRGKSRSKKYENAVPGSGPRGARRSIKQVWVDPAGGEHRTRREALVVANHFGHEPGDELPVLKRL